MSKRVALLIVLILVCASAFVAVKAWTPHENTGSPELGDELEPLSNKTDVSGASLNVLPSVSPSASSPRLRFIEPFVLPDNVKLKGKTRQPTRVPILVYHSISDRPMGIKSLSVRTADFETQLRFLREQGCTPIGFGDLKGFKTFVRPIVVTFDDGYEDNWTNAYPLLKKYGIRATVFMIAGRIDKPGYLTAGEMVQMLDLVSFQSHTVTHPNLSAVGTAALRKELRESKDIITAITGAPVFVLCYPIGKYDGRVLREATGLYGFAVTTEYGCYRPGSDSMRLRRTYVMRNCSMKEFAGLVRQ